MTQEFAQKTESLRQRVAAFIDFVTGTENIPFEFDTSELDKGHLTIKLADEYASKELETLTNLAIQALRHPMNCNGTVGVDKGVKFEGVRDSNIDASIDALHAGQFDEILQVYVNEVHVDRIDESIGEPDGFDKFLELHELEQYYDHLRLDSEKDSLLILIEENGGLPHGFKESVVKTATAIAGLDGVEPRDVLEAYEAAIAELRAKIASAESKPSHTPAPAGGVPEAGAAPVR